MTTRQELDQLHNQQALTVEAIREVLRGNWDMARQFIDAIDPSRAGQWTNVKFGGGMLPTLPEAPPSVRIIDVRGKLPTRHGARPYYLRTLEQITGATIHYTASSPNATVRDIAAYQTGPTAQEDFPAIAYPYVIEGDGTVYVCHDLSVRVWHNAAHGANTTKFAVCYVGHTRPNPAQIIGIAGALAHGMRVLGRIVPVDGHSDTNPTSCPGPYWPQWKPAVMAKLEAFR